MSRVLHNSEIVHLRRSIISQCVWSDDYTSLKDILTKTANHLPLLLSFANDNEEHHISTDTHNGYIILFFDRNVSTKMLFTPLRQLKDEPSQFEVYPNHCTFAIPDLFKGAFEFVQNGHRCSRIFTSLEQLIDFTEEIKCTAVFMSRDSLLGYTFDSEFSIWNQKEYPSGAIFHAQRIHRSSESSRKKKSSYLECLDENYNKIFLKMDFIGRYSIIATSTEQQQNQPEIFLHSTRTSNIVPLIKRLTENKSSNCIRLVRGSVPHNFYCQYLKFVLQHKHDVLVGLTQEDLVIEWNLESHASCRYAVNLHDILDKFSNSWEESVLETYIDNARKHYRENFQVDMQMISTKDWTAFFQYWRWTGDVPQTSKHYQSVSYQSRRRFHLVASIQDLSDDYETLVREFSKSINRQSVNESSSKQETKARLEEQQKFRSGMSRILSKSSQNTDRLSLSVRRPTELFIESHRTPFDDSIYDSNQKHQSSATINRSAPFKPDAQRTQ